ncbi:phage shock envelope stress response protein PspM [Rhodococcus sp. W8901]|uniref:phage shock envelope stress response protein PspM n=1 Tax=unclassified Rhodococcus (in: high G+C Gram-positive bacteria) TaxID=192944 RepID=UPI003F8EB5BF
MSNTRGGRSGRKSRPATSAFEESAGLAASAASAVTSAGSVLREVGGTVADTMRRWSDPRERMLRKRRRARKRATRFGIASGAGVVGSASLAAASAPDWTIVATGGAAALFAIPAVVAVSTYRHLTSVPLPPATVTRQPLPPVGSAARAPMERLASAESGLHQLLGVLSRSAIVDAEEIDHTGETARSASSALRAVAADVVAMESAGRGTAAAAAHLQQSVRAAGEQLDIGVAQYEGLVTAAAKMTAPAQSPSYTLLDRQREELLSASDRLEGWAEALGEVDEIDRRFRR